MIRKAVVMVAGKGVRMLPLTKLVPKPLINVNGKPFLAYMLEKLVKAGLDDIALIVGHRHQMIPQFLKQHGFRATLIYQARRLGTGHALKQAEAFVGNSNFIAAGGDGLWSLRDIRALLKEDTYNYVAAASVANPERYGVLIEHNGFLTKIVEKPQTFVGNKVNTGLYKFTPEIFKALNSITKSSRGEYELTDAITLLAQQKKVKLTNIQDYWLDLGKLDDIARIGKFLIEHPD